MFGRMQYLVQPLPIVRAALLEPGVQSRDFASIIGACAVKCSKVFTTTANQEKHRRHHDAARPVACRWPDCPRTFPTDRGESQHMIMAHNLTTISMGDPAVATPTTTADATTATAAAAGGIGGAATGATGGSYGVFAQSNPVSGKTPKAKVLPCQYPGCTRMFAHVQSEVNHRLLHYDMRPYSCNICTFSTTQVSTIKSHVASMHKASLGQAYTFTPPVFPTDPSAGHLDLAKNRHKRKRPDDITLTLASAASAAIPSQNVDNIDGGSTFDNGVESKKHHNADNADCAATIAGGGGGGASTEATVPAAGQISPASAQAADEAAADPDVKPAEAGSSVDATFTANDITTASDIEPDDATNDQPNETKPASDVESDDATDDQPNETEPASDVESDDALKDGASPPVSPTRRRPAGQSQSQSDAEANSKKSASQSESVKSVEWPASAFEDVCDLMPRLHHFEPQDFEDTLQRLALERDALQSDKSDASLPLPQPPQRHPPTSFSTPTSAPSFMNDADDDRDDESRNRSRSTDSRRNRDGSRSCSRGHTPPSEPSSPGEQTGKRHTSRSRSRSPQKESATQAKGGGGDNRDGDDDDDDDDGANAEYDRNVLPPVTPLTTPDGTPRNRTSEIDSSTTPPVALNPRQITFTARSPHEVAPRTTHGLLRHVDRDEKSIATENRPDPLPISHPSSAAAADAAKKCQESNEPNETTTTAGGAPSNPKATEAQAAAVVGAAVEAQAAAAEGSAVEAQEAAALVGAAVEEDQERPKKRRRCRSRLTARSRSRRKRAPVSILAQRMISSRMHYEIQWNDGSTSWKPFRAVQGTDLLNQFRRSERRALPPPSAT